MKLTGWGNYPVAVDPKINVATDIDSLRKILQSDFNGICFGQGRSYGDSALSNHILLTSQLNHVLDFDPITGHVTCLAGVTIADLIDIFMPRGWFLPVTPGTKYVSIGGAISSDVHGKNHHHIGCFSEHVIEFDLMLPNGEIRSCSPQQNSKLFRSACGGIGLIGFIVKAKIALKSINSSFIKETIIKANDLEETLHNFDEYKDAPYSVAWMDSTASGKHFGRSLLFLGKHTDTEQFESLNKRKISIPLNMPQLTLNKYSISAFNNFYFNAIKKQSVERVVHCDSFFYPLDNIRHWNRMYGKRGFVQYQFVLPKSSGTTGLKNILHKIAESRKASFLTVLKLLGPQNRNYLSFPLEGYTVAMDFPIRTGIFEFLNLMDQVVLENGGRIYLCKDARMSEQVFKQSYPDWEIFSKIRQEYNADKTFNSLQSRRLGI
jgi:FAD/FMN-containing dehydrogenase